MTPDVREGAKRDACDLVIIQVNGAGGGCDKAKVDAREFVVVEIEVIAVFCADGC